MGNEDFIYCIECWRSIVCLTSSIFLNSTKKETHLESVLICIWIEFKLYHVVSQQPTTSKLNRNNLVTHGSARCPGTLCIGMAQNFIMNSLLHEKNSPARGHDCKKGFGIILNVTWGSSCMKISG